MSRSTSEPDHELLELMGRRIREARVRRGLTQLHLAQAADLSVAYVSLIERGGRNPPLTTVASLARALGVGLADLMG
jgi:transcriptional regulator with XRE-family HTH domain